MQAPMTPQINLTELTAGRAEFPLHYTVQNNPNFAPDIVVSMQTLTDAVERHGGVANTKEIIIKLIHRYDGVNWFLTLQCCEINMNTGKLTPCGNRFDLNNGAVTPSQFQGDFDPLYFANVLYDGQAMTPETYVNSVTFPWYQQIKEMQCQNDLLDTEDVYVKFASCTYNYSGYSAASLVTYPHIVLIFLNTPTTGDYVNDVAYPELFKYKACDYGGICPPCCNQYFWPPNLPITPKCLDTPQGGGHGHGHGGHGGGHGGPGNGGGHGGPGNGGGHGGDHGHGGHGQ